MWKADGSGPSLRQVYPVHVSVSFMFSTTLASALYLLLLRFLNRQYHSVARLVDTVASDCELTREENNCLQHLNSSRNSSDQHPDAHGGRSEIRTPSLLTLCS